MDGPTFCADAGSSDAYACNLAPAIASYVTGTHYRVKANTANVGAASINLNSLGAKTIKKAAGGITTDLDDNDIRAGQWVDIIYDGTNMQMQSTLGNTPAGSGTVTPSSTDTFTNKTYDAEAAGNTLITVNKLWLPAAACQNATANLNWDTPVSNAAVAACDTGTNIQKGVADFADGSNLSMQTHVMLPSDWTGAIDARFKWYTPATTGSVVWQVATVCVADGETDDPAFNTASTVTDAAKGTANQTNDATITGLAVTGCAPGELMHIKVFRDSANASDNLAATARLLGVELTMRRAQ